MTFSERYKNPLVVGYKGVIGSFILNGLLQRIMPKALDIWCFDINETEAEKVERIKKSDCIFLCVPLKDTVKWLIKYKKLLKNKIIFEQTSIKAPIYTSKELRGLRFIGMHILFRPSVTPNKEDRKVALIDSQDSDMEKAFIEELTRATVICYKDFIIHDMEMAYLQALVHRVVLTLGSILSTATSSTYVSGKIIELAERIKQGDLDLYKQIQENACAPVSFALFTKEMSKFDIDRMFGEKNL